MLTTDDEKSARFLMQATLGADFDTIKKVSTDGISVWLTAQLNHTVASDDSFLKKTRDIWRGASGNKGFRQLFIDKFSEANINGKGNNPALPYNYYFRMAWWHRTLCHNSSITVSGTDAITETEKVSAIERDADSMVRHRVAQALSEILVISDNSILENNAEGMASYYDLLYKHALGSYKDLLTEVSLHPCMGVYLTHINNRKEVTAQNIHPDENYAREILQLFTIGLYQLNQDGSRKKDSNGKDIPTYNNQDIQQLARVFTGIKARSYLYEWPVELGSGTDRFDFSVENGRAIALDDSVPRIYKMVPYVDMVSQMITEDSFHDQGSKTLPNLAITLAAGQSATAEIEDAVTKLVAHSSTAPFIATKLIQQMVTSNPTPAYVQAVATAFGSQGNLKEAIRTLLEYPLTNPVTVSSGAHINGNIEKLKSPTLRVTQLLKAFKVRNDSGRLWLIGSDLKQALHHHPLSSPTVFNFYKPDFAPHGDIEQSNKVAPEFELVDAHTSISYANMLYDWLFGNAMPLVTTELGSSSTVPELNADELLRNTDDKLKLDLTAELALAANRADHSKLIERISLILTGQINSSNEQAILDATQNYDVTSPVQRNWIVQTVIFMIAASPQFTVLGKWS
ncbi:DUF1800 family protein [Vibrio sp. SCSIO 43137]|uniref:DUF1800 family protein n=1 Tax=Vibrio sp. SCSIO 43137 TaxID=3021011 RepID=UPI002307EBEF|nr:DUF1800 family protein [Vibrio sp. SCSIO 43137]WCE29343.1 DUF1800 family protein [Vibrio sp. SCSIO 43137]